MAAAGIGTIASYLNKRARRIRRELQRSREANELYAGYEHTLKMQLQEAGITPRRRPAALRRLIHRDDDEDADDD